MFQTQQSVRNEILAVGTSSIIAFEPRIKNNERTEFTIRNTSDADNKIITVNFGFNQAVVNSGIVLRRNESISASNETGYKCHQGTITVICAVADGQLSIMER